MNRYAVAFVLFVGTTHAMPNFTYKTVLRSTDFAFSGSLLLVNRYGISQTQASANACVSHLRNYGDEKSQRLIEQIRREKNSLSFAVTMGNIMKGGLYLLNHWNFSEHRVIDSPYKIIFSTTVQAIVINTYPWYKARKLNTTIKYAQREYNIQPQLPMWKKIFYKFREVIR